MLGLTFNLGWGILEHIVEPNKIASLDLVSTLNIALDSASVCVIGISSSPYLISSLEASP